MMSRIKTGVFFLLLLAVACVEPFNPPRENSNFLGYLVVDGYLDGEHGAATVKLTRSTELTAYMASPPETGASVVVETGNGGSFSLKEGYDGLYTADHLSFDAASNYRLLVTIKNGTTYSSNYITMRQSPSFDSLVWRPEDKGIRFFVNGHDDTGKTRYYQYLFTETWSYGVPFVSHYKNIGGLPVQRKKNELVSDCWDSRSSADVLVKATTDISKDVVSMFPVNFLPRGTRKLEDLYTIMVEQRAISQDEYNFWQLLRKTNESLGGLFDPIPSQVLGNVHNDDNPDEPVLGYFTGGFSKQIRIFVKLPDLPKYLQDLDPFSFECGVHDFVTGGDQQLGSQIYLDYHTYPNTWFVTSANCGDCRTLGGDTIRPKFWPQ
jgi:hypothetical protein